MSDTSAMMTADRFRTLLEAYGADPLRWPESERLAAARFVESVPEARALLAEALTLDNALAALPVPEFPSALLENVLAGAGAAFSEASTPVEPASPSMWWARFRTLWPGAPGWAPAGVLVGAAALGMVVGVNLDASYLSDGAVLASADQAALTLPDAQDLAALVP